MGDTEDMEDMEDMGDMGDRVHMDMDMDRGDMEEEDMDIHIPMLNMMRNTKSLRDINIYLAGKANLEHKFLILISLLLRKLLSVKDKFSIRIILRIKLASLFIIKIFLINLM
jgi:hypothetical protein